MRIPLELSFRNVQKTEAIESLVNEKAAKLEQVCNYMISCRVVIEKPQEHQRKGNPYRVRIDIKVPPGHEIVAVKDSRVGDMHRPLQGVIRDAFLAARKQLVELTERQRDDVKAHPESEVKAVIARIFKEEWYGFIATSEGREIYFHRNAVVNDDFDNLKAGIGVRFVEEEGEKGPQATTVQVLDRTVKQIVEVDEKKNTIT